MGTVRARKGLQTADTGEELFKKLGDKQVFNCMGKTLLKTLKTRLDHILIYSESGGYMIGVLIHNLKKKVLVKFTYSKL